MNRTKEDIADYKYFENNRLYKEYFNNNNIKILVSSKVLKDVQLNKKQLN